MSGGSPGTSAWIDDELFLGSNASRRPSMAVARTLLLAIDRRWWRRGHRLVVEGWALLELVQRRLRILELVERGLGIPGPGPGLGGLRLVHLVSVPLPEPAATSRGALRIGDPGSAPTAWR